ncbi:polyamine ABC transporter ATP-binding protein [Bordetella genomosp. 10]|uniref:Polyamine ABC transporter ATP-binding protein n=1 Tax=Bordetella genomosp. 10 TaxID=1416804 RepID=A0A261S114_9BORD|nr:ABC transporter ATP-binding protein [Bordetella genomosp. 10]OZI30622.1 polyamine ABC transporter ATP-binding protein [Bordetella genomosp. 10]
MTAIRIDQLTCAFGDMRAVDGISATIAHGELFTLLGPSGCGKTTLLRSIAGFNDVASGSIWLGDKRIDSLPAHQRNIGMVFQNYAIFPNLNVADNVAYGLRARRTPAAEIAARVEKALQRVRLEGYGPRWPHQLSGGQLQRVAIARALVIEPAVLLFDEPLSNLDAQLRTDMRVEIRRLQQSLGLTAVYVTHDQEEALAISDRIAVLRDGRVEQVGTPEDIYRHPKTPFVASFLGGTNMLPGVAGVFDGAATPVQACGGTISVPGRIADAGAKVLLSIRPEALRVAGDGSGAHLSARLVLREFLGQIQRLHAELPDGTPVRVSTLGAAALEVREGASFGLAYDPAQIVAFPAS